MEMTQKGEVEKMKATIVQYRHHKAFACFTQWSRQYGIPWLSIAIIDADYMFDRSFTADAVNEVEHSLAWRARLEGFDVEVPERVWDEWDYTEDEFRDALARLHPECVPYGMMDDRLRVAAKEAIETLMVHVDNDMHQRRYALVRMNDGQVLKVYARCSGFGTSDLHHGVEIPAEWQRILEAAAAAKKQERRAELERALRAHGMIA